MVSLEKCKVCNGEKASTAHICPHCGYQEGRKWPIWLWAIIILIFGLIVYFMLPINHIIDIQLIKEQQPAQTIIIQQVPAQETYISSQALDSYNYTEITDYVYVTADELLAYPSKAYEGETFAITGMILDVTYHDYIPYFRLMSLSGVETT